MVIVQVEISSRKILTRRIWEIQEVCWKAVKVRQSRNDIFQAKVSSKKQTNEFYFTTMKPHVDLFSFFLEEIEDTKKTFQNELTFGFVEIMDQKKVSEI